MEHQHRQRRPVPRGGVLEHLNVAVRIARGEDGTSKSTIADFACPPRQPSSI
jgi:hypothetical protein